MSPGLFPNPPRTKLDFAIIISLCLMVGYELHVVADNLGRWATAAQVAASPRSMMVSTGAAPLAYCAWVRA